MDNYFDDSPAAAGVRGDWHEERGEASLASYWHLISKVQYKLLELVKKLWSSGQQAWYLYFDDYILGAEASGFYINTCLFKKTEALTNFIGASESRIQVLQNDSRKIALELCKSTLMTATG